MANQSENAKEQIMQVERRVAAEALHRPGLHGAHTQCEREGALISLHSATHKARVKGAVLNLCSGTKIRIGAFMWLHGVKLDCSVCFTVLASGGILSVSGLVKFTRASLDFRDE